MARRPPVLVIRVPLEGDASIVLDEYDRRRAAA